MMTLGWWPILHWGQIWSLLFLYGKMLKLYIFKKPLKSADMLSGTKKQLWSRHTNFCKKSHENSKFLLLGSKGFCKAVLVCRLRFLQSCTCVSFTGIKNINWFLYRVYPVRKPSVAEILHSLFTYTLVRDDLNDNRCTYNIDNQYCLLLNILGDTSFSGIKCI